MKKYILTLIITTAAFLAATGAAQAECPAGAECIGSEALVELPTSALWSSVVNFRPGDGETVDLNPPRFSWSYTPDPSQGYLDNENKTFQFQISYDPGFSSLIVDMYTPLNMYNFLAPFTPGATVYWRVGYIHDGGSSPYIWSSVRHFTVASDAKTWDRSMLADEAYLAEKGKHPHLLFNASNRQVVYQYLQAAEQTYLNNVKTAHDYETGRGWYWVKRYANDAISSSWWTSDNPTLAPNNLYQGAWAEKVANVAFAWQLTRDEKYLNAKPQEALIRLTRYFLAKGGDQTDLTSGVLGQEFIRSLSFSYDWLYEIMTPEQRQEVLNALERSARYDLRGGVAWWQTIDPKTAWGKGDPNGVYPGPYYMLSSSHTKVGSSHPGRHFYATMMAALAAYPEGQSCRELFDIGVNYMIGKTYWPGDDGGLNQGRPYSAIAVYDGIYLERAIFAQITFPEAKFNMNPFFSRTADWWSKITPVDFTQGHEPWGDTGWGRNRFWGMTEFGRDYAYFTGDGKALQHWQLEAALRTGYIAPMNMEELVIPFHFNRPEPTTSTSLSETFIDAGWAMGCTYPSNTKACYNDGVGFVFQARPRGSEGGHSHYSDLSYQLWAYGTTITDAGAQMSSYAKVPMCHYSLLVDGLGTVQSPKAPLVPYYSRIFAFKDAADYTYVAADGTNAYPRAKFNAGGWLMPLQFSNLHSNGPLSYLTKAHRHILFMRKKYFILFDDLESAQPAKFTWLYHVREDTLQLDAANASFTYTTSNKLYTDSNGKPIDEPGPLIEVPVQVAHISQPQELEVLDLKGDKVRSNPFTGEDYYSQGDSHYRAHALWISNKTPQAKFHFMSVIYPVKPGTAMPQIKRLDDYTVEVTNGNEHDVVSFDTQTPFPATVVVDTVAVSPPALSGTPGSCVLSLSGYPGTVAKTPNKTSYDYDENVTISATPYYGYLFNGWSGDIPVGSEMTNPLTIDMGHYNKVIKANFPAALGTYALTTPYTPSGSVTRSPNNLRFYAGETATLTARPAKNYHFLRWEEGANTYSDNPLLITMNADRTINAVFAPDTSAMPGDVSGNFAVSAYDAALVLQDDPRATVEQVDLNGDLAVDALDAALIAQRAVGLQ